MLIDTRSEGERCPLCSAGTSTVFFSEPERTYFRCSVCRLVFLQSSDRPTPLVEVLRYTDHENAASDEGYVGFLRRLADPMMKRLPLGSRGLDYGCGPAPVLGAVFTENGFPTQSFDPVFHPDYVALDARYDFLTCCEVIEHVQDPDRVFEQFAALVVSGGCIGIMTQPYDTAAAFGPWWYRRDPTHVCFYHRETFEWIAHQFGWTFESPEPSVAVFRT